MSFENILNKYITKELPIEEENQDKYWTEVKNKENKYKLCNVWRYRQCHPHSKPLSKIEIL